MSYILDALQKSANDTQPPQSAESFPGIDAQQQNPTSQGPTLALPWKLAIGAILLTNVALVFLWRTDQPDSKQVTQANSASNPAITPVSATEAARSRGKIPLPGIVSPRDLPAPGSSTSTVTQRTFKPTGRAITIAGEPDRDDLLENTPLTPDAQTSPAITQRVIAQPTTAPPSTKASNASALSAISDSARSALHALTFSFHIYGNETDLRSLGVNGQRRIEGQSITADNGTTFTVAEITETGAIIEFDHEGETVSVVIPVMEDWKDS